MGVSVYVELHRKNTDPAHAAKLAACRAIVEAGDDELPPGLAAYFGTSYAQEAIDNAAEAAHMLSMAFEREDEPPWVSRPSDRYESILEIDLDKLPEDLRVVRVRYG